jgi:hypothetical protein
VLAIVAIVSLIISFFIGKNAIWGTFTLGIVVAVIVLFIFKNNGFNWLLFKQVLIISVLVGAFFELIGRLGNAMKSKKS